MHLRSKLFVAALVGLGLMASSTMAASLTYILDLSVPGVADLYADVSSGDNGGLAAWGVGLTGNFLSSDNISPYTVNSANFAPAGFNVVRTLGDQPNNYTTGAVASPFLSGSQDTVSGPAANLVYGLGQEANSWATYPGITPAGFPDATTDSAWGAVAIGSYDNPVRLATLTYEPTGELPGFDTGPNNTNSASIFEARDANPPLTFTPPISYDIITGGPDIPEPATISLLGLAAIGFFGFIRRR